MRTVPSFRAPRPWCMPIHPVLVAFFAALLVGAPRSVHAQTSVQGNDPGLTRLAREIERLASLSGGVPGVAARHLETGRTVMLNGEQRFPMASSYKVPIAVTLLTRVDSGEVRLDSMIALRPGDLHPGSGMLSELLNDPGVSLSLRNYLELMLLISDNSATDIVLRTAGGGAAVTERMAALNVNGIRVDRPTVALIGDWVGVRGLPANNEIALTRYVELARAVPDARRDSAAAAFNRDPRDTATPAGMTTLLERIWRGQAVSQQSTALLLDIMKRSTTGAGRIRGLLPPDVSVAHKTGTIGGTTNDVGIITLPDSAGHVAIAVFVKESNEPVEQRERAIAQIARAVYDYFLFNPGAARD